MTSADDAVTSSLFSHNYVVKELLGKGGFGECYKVFSLKYETFFACKVTRLDRSGKQKDVLKRSYETEIEILKKVEHPNIIKPYQVWEDDDFLFLILEYCDCMNLETLLQKKEKPSLKQILKIVDDVCRAMNYLHQKGICHHDIKPENILITNNGMTKIVDFGVSSIYNSSEELENTVKGTHLFMSPDKISGQEYDPFMADIWAFGVTLYRIIYRKYPFNAKNIHDLRKEHTNGFITNRKGKGYDVLIKIIRQCMTQSPHEKVTFEEILNHIGQYKEQFPDSCEPQKSNLPSLNKKPLRPYPANSMAIKISQYQPFYKTHTYPNLPLIKKIHS